MAGEKITRTLEQELDKLDRQCLRAMQMKSFLCSADCCKDTGMSKESVQRCLEGCMNPVVRLQETTNTEVNQLQERLNRCALQCQDEVKDILLAGSSSSSGVTEATAQKKAEECLFRCEDKHLQLIPGIIDRIKRSAGCK